MLNSTLATIDSVFDISSIVVIILAIVVILQIYAVLPTKRRTRKSQLPGAIVTGLCWMVFTDLFAIVISKSYKYSIYGSLATLFMLLLWLRYILIILFAGCALNRVLEEEQNESSESS